VLTSEACVRRTGIDAVALKPAEVDVTRAFDLPVEAVTIDYEGREHVPDADVLAALAREKRVRVTVPVRADGFDPLGDDSLLRALPDEVGRVLVAGHPAYLGGEERERAVSPRFGRAVAATDDPWVGTEGVERPALATGATQFELLSRDTGRAFRGLRAAGFDGGLAVYAPTVVSDDEDEILAAVGGYVARRGPVRCALPEGAATDADATGRARDVLLRAAEDYALTGSVADVRDRVEELRDAGADHVVGYPARGVDAFLA
jgi:hypothetical protein